MKKLKILYFETLLKVIEGKKFYRVSVTVKIAMKKNHSLNPLGLDGPSITGEPCEEESTLGQAGGAETSPSS